MKLNKRIRLCALLFAVVFLFTGCLSAAYEFNYDGAEEYSTEDLQYFGSRIQNIQIHWYAGKVTFVESDERILRVVEEKELPEGADPETADRTSFLTDAEKMHWYIETVEKTDSETKETVAERTLHIEYCEANYLGTIPANKKHLVVQVPAGVNINAEVYDADVVIDKATLGSVVLSTTGGDIQINELNVNDMSIASVSGLVHIGELTAQKNIQLLTSLGFIKIGDVKAETLSVNNPLRGVDIGTATISGMMDLQSTAGLVSVGTLNAPDATISSLSGSVNVGIGECTKARVQTETGSILLSLALSGATLEFDTVNGRFTCDEYNQEGNKYIMGSGACKLKVITNSGNLSVKVPASEK